MLVDFVNFSSFLGLCFAVSERNLGIFIFLFTLSLIVGGFNNRPLACSPRLG